MRGPTLDALGPRICILGPSNSGKSTLAAAIARARGLPVVHLDQLHHEPGTDWRPRRWEVFAALHAQALRGERWVMDGNYSRLLAPRLARATGLILLDAPAPVSLLRYLRRSWFQRDRVGALEGGRDSVKWDMILHILGPGGRSRGRYAAIFEEAALPKASLATRGAVDDFCRSQGLEPRLTARPLRPPASAARSGPG